MTWRAPRTAGPDAPTPGRILLVEPYRGGVSLVRDYLRNYGYAVERCYSVADALRRFEGTDVDLCVLDGEFGSAVLEACGRVQGRAAAIVMAPARDELGLAALEAGADDFLAKPVNLRELVARIRAVLRARQRRCTAHRIGETLVLHGSGRLAASDGRSACLTPRQHHLLAILSSRPGEVVARTELLDLIFGRDCEIGDRIIDVHVSRLRKRLAEVGAADLVSSYRGVGYRLAADDDPKSQELSHAAAFIPRGDLAGGVAAGRP